MMSRIWALAFNTYREAVRQKVFYILFFFSAALIFLSVVLGQLSIGAETKIVKDMGLASMFFFGVMIAISSGIGLVFKEIDRRTIYTILSKPVSRAEFILGKYVGLALTVGVVVLAMAILLFGMLSLYREPIDFNLWKAIICIYAELCIVIAIAMVFSSYSTQFMSAIFCISFLILGHLTDDFLAIVTKKVWRVMKNADATEQMMGQVLLGIANFFSFFSLDHFAINSDIVHGVIIPWSNIWNALGFALCWVVILLSAAIWLFRRKDLQ